MAAFALGLACWFLLRRRPPKTWVAWYEHGVLRQTADDEPEAWGWDEIDQVARQDVQVVKAVRQLYEIPAAGGAESKFLCSHRHGSRPHETPPCRNGSTGPNYGPQAVFRPLPRIARAVRKGRGVRPVEGRSGRLCAGT